MVVVAVAVASLRLSGDYDLPHGLYGQSAVYSEHAHHLAVMRKILLRMATWMDYLFPFH